MFATYSPLRIVLFAIALACLLSSATAVRKSEYTVEEVQKARDSGKDLCEDFGGISFWGHEDHNEVCCKKNCGKCGGTGCNSRLGSGENCCVSPIIDNAKECKGKEDAPCVLPGLPLSW
ncbi:hypothetical protein SARC_02429 [Sphaeroforma arctica JP610]|uniref:Uncharacterized protein n=1 Tax=Sphaeroforma arctica JP610 TaxID=667725 RepID=A0A0L0GAV5_9EUKA|nr:hypothetical protein SARC_02429 [Sphaeroforma arctica JP610]KNC85398.1 hypothetical protein SARC_02429 [Sphaeroforma arctica JP610]|eukprot:XP_014159300.1 hypothetical protein SARC_02429 [Sphaeroforma arctica JP610]